MKELTSPSVHSNANYPFKTDDALLKQVEQEMKMYLPEEWQPLTELNFDIQVINAERQPVTLRAINYNREKNAEDIFVVNVPLRFRRASAILLFFENEKLFVHNYLSQQTISCNQQCAGFLSGLENWHSIANMVIKLGYITPSSLTDALITLLKNNVIVTEQSPADDADTFFRKNWHWGHQGAFFHFGTKYRDVISPEFHKIIQKFRAKLIPSPALYTTNHHFQPEAKLPRPAINGTLYQTMANRRTNRNLLDVPIPLDVINKSLFFSMSVTGMIESPDIIDLPLKMTPSGGARNPFEAYVYARNVTGLEPGIYHYSAKEHSLGKLSVGKLPTLASLCAAGQEGTENAAAAIFLVACLDRVMWKYRHPFSYRTVFIEAGHIAQNIILVAVEHGLTANPTGAFNEDTLEDVLQINAVTQSAVYSLLIGNQRLMMYNYYAYGLNFASEIQFPELIPISTTNADVVIRKGAVPQQLIEKENQTTGSIKMNAQEYLQLIPAVAGVYISNGSSIVIDPYPGIDEKSIRLLLLGISMAAIVYQRNLIPLHASAINYRGGLAVFCGLAGSGKTTLVSALKLKGYRVFSDDVCVLGKLGSDELLSWPSYPMLKICEDTFEKLGLGPVDDQHRLRAGFHKYAHFFYDDFVPMPKRIHQVFLLNCHGDSRTLTINKLAPVEAFQALLKNTYKPGQVSGMKKGKVLFEIASQLAAEAQVYRVIRPATGNFIAELVSLIETYLPEERHPYT